MTSMRCTHHTIIFVFLVRSFGVDIERKVKERREEFALELR